MNPVGWLDLRVRVRERRLWLIAAFFLAIPALICGLSLWLQISETNLSELEPGSTGQILALCALCCQAGLLQVLAPLAAAQRISQEREQRTLPALVNSPLTPSSIAFGKLLGAWAFTLWLGMLTLPFVVVALLWGGTAIWVPLATFGINLIMGLTLSTLALGMSGLFGRSLSAYLATGVTLFFWCAALPIMGGLIYASMENIEHQMGLLRAVWCAFLFHNPGAPQIWVYMRGIGEGITFTDWGVWVPLYGIAAWSLVNLLGFWMAVRGLRREVL